MAELSPEAAKVLEARRSAIDGLKAIDTTERKVSDPDVIPLANARLYEQAVTLRVLSGEVVSAAEFKAAHEMVEPRATPRRSLSRFSFESSGLQTRPMMVLASLVWWHVAVVIGNRLRVTRSASAIAAAGSVATIISTARGRRSSMSLMM